MTKKDGMSKLKGWAKELSSISVAVGIIVFAGYKVYGQEMVKDTIKEELKPIIIRLALVEASAKSSNKNDEKIIDQMSFVHDWMRRVNEDAFNAVEKDRNKKKKWLEN